MKTTLALLVLFKLALVGFLCYLAYVLVMHFAG